MKMQVCGLLILTLAVASGFGLRADLEGTALNFAKEIQLWVRTGQESPRFSTMIGNLALPKDWYRKPATAPHGLNGERSCAFCKAAANSSVALRRQKMPAARIQKALAKLCIQLNIQNERVCRGLVSLNLPVLLWIIDRDPTVTDDDICGLLFENSGCFNASEKFDWTVKIDAGPPRIVNREPSKEQIKILHITDIHYDPLYQPGGNAECDEPICCRKDQGAAVNSTPAGHWGDYRSCDVPWHAVADTLEQIKHQHADADLVYYTGDIVDHGMWATTRQGNAESIKKVYGKMKEVFGETPVYPVIGNHEANPLDVFASSNIDDDRISTNWLYKLMADIWIGAGWLPECTRDTILRGGFYSVSPKKGFRVIGLSNAVAYPNNWWLLYEPIDLGGQLKWLADTLLKAERNGEIVHILAHIPSGSEDQQNTWSQEYRRTINRFAHIIAGQFNGHTHNDEFNLFYQPDNFTEVIGVAWNGGSVTPWTYLNPNYRVYSANANTYEVEEAVTWIYNLTEANLTPDKRPNWFASYSFKNEYGLEDLSKESLRDLVAEMARGGPKVEAYNRNYYKRADPSKPWACNEACALTSVCNIVTTVTNDSSECDYVREQN